MTSTRDKGQLMTKSSGDQLAELKEHLEDKSATLKEFIDADEKQKDALLDELKAITGKLEQVDRRLGKLNHAKKEYLKTLQETNFALDKIESAAQQMKKRFDTYRGVNDAPPEAGGIAEVEKPVSIMEQERAKKGKK